MKQHTRFYFSAALALILATIACNAFSSGGEAPTQVVIVEVTVTPPQVVMPTNTQPPPPPGVTPSSPPPAPGATATTCNLSSVFQSDVTIPDDSPITTGQAFTKTWRLKNNGCQKWPAGTLLVFISGDQMGGPASVTVPETAAGGVQDVSVNLKAPATAGDYKGFWKLKTSDGVLFGDQIYVKIKAVAPSGPTATPTVPGVSVDFTASYVGGVWSCTSGPLTLYMYTAIVKNTGPTAFESVATNIQQPPDTIKNSGSNNTGFQTAPTNADCNASGFHASSLPPGATAWVSAFVSGSPLPGGTAARLMVRLCTADNLGGTCKKLLIDFTPNTP